MDPIASDRLSAMIEGANPEAWRPYYIRHRHLKEVSKKLAFEVQAPVSQPGADTALRKDPVSRFQEMLQTELTKVNQFASVKHANLFCRLCEECTRLSKGEQSLAELEQTEQQVIALGDEVVHLDSFVRLNYLAFQSVSRKFDKNVGVSGSGLFRASLHSERFCNVRFDDLLILLGLAWERLRAARSKKQTQDGATWVPPESFVRNTAKYWVRPDKVVLLKTRVLQHMPYLIFGASMRDQEQLLEHGQKEEEKDEPYSGALEEAQLLSSIYFDSLDGSCYNDRIHRKEGARLVRFRWYGENSGETDKEVYIERKIHHEGWNSDESVKERCILPQNDVLAFMKGTFDIDEHFRKLALADSSAKATKSQKAMKNIANEVNTLIQERQMQPMVRTSYYRCAFQLATSNEVRVSLDTQMTLLNEFQGDGHPTQQWCLTGDDPIKPDAVYRFPFAILEIKLQNVAETPQWLRKILAEVEAVQVHKFSKYQHGLAFLHPHRVQILPHWYQDFRDWHERRQGGGKRPDPRIYSKYSTLKSDEDLLEPIPRLNAILAPGGEGHLLKDMDNNDPKVVFANERTLLHYAEKGIYLGTLAVYMMRQGGAMQWVGFALMAMTLGLLISSLAEYYKRLDVIKSRGGAVAKNRAIRLDWMRGPLLVAAVVCVSLIFSAVLACLHLQARLEAPSVLVNASALSS